MREIILVLLLILVSSLFSGCVFTSVRIPYDTDLDSTEFGTKEGVSSWTSILWLFAWGDAGTKTAARNADITTVKHMDKEILSILFGLYHNEETIVYGD